MTVKDRLQDFKAQLRKELSTIDKQTKDEVSYVEMGVSQSPKISEKRGVEWVSFGEDNLWPLKISDLKYGSGTHNGIISSCADLISGDGYLIDGAKTKEESEAKYNALSPQDKANYDVFMKNANGGMTIEKLKKKLAFDVKEQGAYCYEIIFSNDFKTIAGLKYVDVKNIRAGKIKNDKVENYWYSRDWKNPRHAEFKPKELFAYSPDDREHLNQIVYEKIGNMEYYGVPDYVGGVNWIQIDFQMGLFHLSNIENGMNPSMKLQFYKLPASEQDKQDILSKVKKQFTGASTAGRPMVFFSEGRDLAPTIEPVQTSNLDKQLIHLAELCDRKILTSHKLTSPLLAGISTSGQMGGNTEIEKAFKIFDSSRMAPYRNMLDESIQDKMDYNKIGRKIKTNPFNPFV